MAVTDPLCLCGIRGCDRCTRRDLRERPRRWRRRTTKR